MHYANRIPHIFLHAPMPVAWVGPDYTYCEVNLAFARELGRTPEQVVGHTMPELLGDAFFQEHVKPHHDHAALGEIVEYSVFLNSGQGGAALWHVQALPQFDPSGVYLGVFVYAQDRTREHAAQTARARFLSIVSHELRTPLTAIINSLELAVEQNETVANRDALQLAQDSADSLAKIIDSIITYSTLETGRTGLQQKPFELNVLLQKILVLLQPEAMSKGLVLELHSLAPESAVIVTDKQCLEQILLQLLDNAIKFTSQGHIHLHARIAPCGDSVGSGLFLEIADTGIGMDAEAREQMLEPFYQAQDGTNRCFDGVGLGIPIVHRMVTTMKGSFWVTSNTPQGLIAHVFLPIEVLS